MMRIRDLFTVPEGQKVTEKHLRRVLISSVCSILLCMSCLVGTTWAWFTVSIENTDNVIQIGTPEVRLTVNNEAFDSGSKLDSGTYVIQIEHANDSDAFQRKCDLYVTLTIQYGTETTYEYAVLSYGNQYCTEVHINADMEFALSWQVSWLEPPNATELTEDPITVIIEEPTEPSTEAPTESTGEETGESTEQPSESATEPSEEPSSEPTEPSSQPTSEPTEPSSQPTEENTPEPTVEATAEPTEETTETTAATDPSDETTEPVTESTAATGETEETTEPDQPQE